MDELTNQEIEQLNEWAGFFSIKPTFIFAHLITRPERFIALYTGNRYGKTVSVAKQYVMRIFGIHPIEHKNMRTNKRIRTYRFASATLPNEPDGAGEIRNTQYPAFKRLLPKSLIKKDITARRPAMTIIDPQGGKDIIIEFVSFSQEVQDVAGVERASIWLDEKADRSFFEEQMPRIITSDGDIIHTFTPALGHITWEYEEVYEKAKTYIRTDAVCKRLEQRFGRKVGNIEITNSKEDICVMQAATDDNPFFTDLVIEKNKNELNLVKAGKHPIYKTIESYKPITVSSYIDEFIGTYSPDTIDVRRYGMFRQMSGRIFKDYEPSIHIIDAEKYFPEGLPYEWTHARGIDYHEAVDWHCGFIAISPDDEAFIYDELVISPERNTTYVIANQIVTKSKDYKYTLNKIDPLAAKKQTNTNLSTIEDLNRYFYDFNREKFGTGGYWTSWDTKSTRGREVIRERLANAKIAGKPFNNTMVRNGRTVRLPTIWILSNCRHSAEAMKNWRLEEWGSQDKLETKDIKETPQQKWSHMNMVWEALFKEAAFRARSNIHDNTSHINKPYNNYFRGAVV